MHSKLLEERGIQKKAQAIGNLIGKKIEDAVTQSYSDKIKKSQELYHLIFKRQKIRDSMLSYQMIDMYLQKKEQIIDKLRLM